MLSQKYTQAIKLGKMLDGRATSSGKQGQNPSMIHFEQLIHGAVLCKCKPAVTNTETSLALTQFAEELIENSHEVPQCKVVVCHHSLYLVELCQMSGVQCLIAEHSVDGEPFDWSEHIL